MRSCGRVIFEYNNTPCNCVTSETISGLYINGGANFPSNAANNSLHFVKYDDNVVVYKKTNTGWIEVQNYSIGGSDTDTIIRFVEILPSGEWKWEVFDVVNNVVISNFNTPPVIAQIQSFEEQNVNYTGTQLPISPGINIGDTKRVKFSNFVYVNYTWDGTIWVKKYHEWNPYTESYWDDIMLCEPIGAINSGDVYVAQYGVVFIGIDPQYIPENGVIIVTNSCGKLHLHWDGTNLIFDGFQKIVGEDKFHTNILGTAPYDPLNPLTGWVAPSSPIAGNTAQVYFTDGIIVNFTFNDPLWEEDFPINIANRPWGTATIPTPKTADSVNIVDDIHHTGKANIGGVLTHQTFYDAQIDNGLRVHGPTRNTYDNYAINSVTLNVNPTTGNDFLEPREYVDNSGVFQTLNAAINYINNSSFTGLNTIVLTGTTSLAPAVLSAGSLFRGKQTNINANGQFISINGIFNNYGQIALNWGTYTFTGNFLWRNFYNSGFYAWTPTFNLSATNTTAHFLFRVGASGKFDSNTINYAGNNTSFAAMETSTSVNLFNTNFQTNGFTGCKLAKEPFTTYANSNTFNINPGSWINISAQALDVTHCTIIYDNRYYHGFVTLPTLASITDQNLNVYAGNLKIYDVLKFDNNAAATVDVGVVWATSATNTVSLPEGVLMVKY